MKRVWNNSLVSKVFISYLAIVVLLFASFYFYSSTLVRNFYISSLSRHLEQTAHLLASVLPSELEGPELDSLARERSEEIGARITVIAADGKVLGDSAEESGRMENHGSRPEVIAAFSKTTGTTVRHSTTVGYEMLYAAVLQADGDRKRILRVAMPLTEIESVITSLRWTLFVGLLVASGLGLMGAYGFSQHLSRRIKRLVAFSEQAAHGEVPQNFFPIRGHDEIHLLEQKLNEMSAKIHDNINRIVTEKEKADSILRCMIEGVLVLNSKGSVLVINEQAEKMFHTPPGRDIHGASVMEISRHPEMRKILREALTFDFSTRRYSKEVELDEERWFRVNAVSLTDHKGTTLGLILVFHDISDIKRFETMRSDFVANVSHELRTPLTAIRGYVETLLHTPPADPKDSQQFLGIIDRHSERLSRLTEDLLALSDLESGKVQMLRQPVEVGQLIQRVLEVFWEQAAKKPVELSQAVALRLPPLSGDLDRLQQLFINLVDNAVKYTPPGGRVTISAAPLPGNNGTEPRIEIAVSDTGPGIPEKDLPRLTERFYRVDKARSRDMGGTGLGLAIVKHIVQAHNGELKIESVLRKGTTIRVWLPAVDPLPNHKVDSPPVHS
jgi:two-component system, OmpR family, phosphate regulon sensor histidine kinase PhoR